MSGTQLQPDIVAQLNQFQTQVENMAPIILSYYSKLRAECKDTELVNKLTIDFHRLYWIKILGINLPAGGLDE